MCISVHLCGDSLAFEISPLCRASAMVRVLLGVASSVRGVGKVSKKLRHLVAVGDGV